MPPLLREIVGNPFRPMPFCRQRGECVRTTGITLPCQGDYARIIGGCKEPCFYAQARPWLTPDVLHLAQAAYDERENPSGHLDPARLAVLADAIEEAGCDQLDLLQHLRGRERCVGCKGTGRRDVQVDAGYGNPLMTRQGWAHCYVCNDYGRGQALGWKEPRGGTTHVRGCWALDLILGKG